LGSLSGVCGCSYRAESPRPSLCLACARSRSFAPGRRRCWLRCSAWRWRLRTRAIVPRFLFSGPGRRSERGAAVAGAYTAMATPSGGDRLDLAVLLGACVHLARRAGRIIKEVRVDSNLGAYNKKAEGDTRDAATMAPAEVLTIADTRAQDAIVSSLRAMFPGVRIVGEEDESEPPPSKEAITALEEVAPLPASIRVPEGLAESLTLADTCLWIDPLDGTIEFVRGNLHNVAVLIGVAVRDRPIAGVVHQPFVGGDAGTVTYGAVGVGVFGDLSPPSADAPADFTVAMEPSFVGKPEIREGIAELSKEAKQNVSQGCGQNLLKLLRGETSVFLQAPGSSRWDICAGEALLMAVGGKVTDLDGSAYIYKQGEPSYINANGLIAARTEVLHSRVAPFFGSGDQARKKAKVEGS